MGVCTGTPSSRSHVSQGGREGATQLQLDPHKLRKSSSVLRVSQSDVRRLPAQFLGAYRGQHILVLLRTLNSIVFLC